MICDVEAGFVLRVVTVEEEAGLVGGAEEGFRDDRSAKPINHRAGLQSATADLQVIMDRFGGEVHKLQMDTCKTIQCVTFTA